LNDACVIYKKPLVSGSAVRWEGQMCIYNWRDGPCYRCVFPEPILDPTYGACDKEGVIGPAPGIIGMMQAMETIKICAGLHDEVLYRRLICYDGLNCKNPWKVVTLRERSDKCAVCGSDPLVTTLESIDYDSFCPRWPKYPNLGPDFTIEPDEFVHLVKVSAPFELEKNLPYVLLDVRPEQHFKVSHVQNSINWPLNKIMSSIDKALQHGESLEEIIKEQLGLSTLESKKKVIAICRRGNDSAIATSLLNDHLSKISKKIDCSSSNVLVVNLSGGLTKLREVINLSSTVSIM